MDMIPNMNDAQFLPQSKNKMNEVLLFLSQKSQGLNAAIRVLKGPPVIWTFNLDETTPWQDQFWQDKEQLFAFDQHEIHEEILAQAPEPSLIYIRLDQNLPSQVNHFAKVLLPIVRLAAETQTTVIWDRQSVDFLSAPTVRDLLFEHPELQEAYKEGFPYLEIYPVLSSSDSRIEKSEGLSTKFDDIKSLTNWHDKEACVFRGSVAWISRMETEPNAWYSKILYTNRNHAMCFARTDKNGHLHEDGSEQDSEWAAFK
jgi:hypothetical protein